jgi:hypothetical protein
MMPSEQLRKEWLQSFDAETAARIKKDASARATRLYMGILCKGLVTETGNFCHTIELAADIQRAIDDVTHKHLGDR